jgi:O-methyltransferase
MDNVVVAVAQHLAELVLRHPLIDARDDESAAVILRGIREAAPAESKLLVIEMIMPEEPGRHLAKVLDIGMLTMHTGRERTQAEYARLFESAQFRLERIVGTPSEVHILEVVPA